MATIQQFKMARQILLLFYGNLYVRFHVHTSEWEENDFILIQNNLPITMPISHLDNKTGVQSGMQVGSCCK